jgi:uncharacterized protein
MTLAHRILDPALSHQVAAGLCALAVMTKAPRAGKVKTRLVPPLTPEEAATLNVCFLRDTTAAISDVARGGKASGVAVYTPVGTAALYQGILPKGFSLLSQRGEVFGERLSFAAQDLLHLGFDSVCLIDSDSPTVPQTAFAEAVKILSQPGDPVVLGPSDDGGYYLIGLKKLHRRIFEEIDWSTEKVLDQTLQRAAELGLQVHCLPRSFDVDDGMTLRRLCEELVGGASLGQKAPATQRFFAELIAREGRERIWPM